jgi:hypothetical protein
LYARITRKLSVDRPYLSGIGARRPSEIEAALRAELKKSSGVEQSHTQPASQCMVRSVLALRLPFP